MIESETPLQSGGGEGVSGKVRRRVNDWTLQIDYGESEPISDSVHDSGFERHVRSNQ